MPAAKLFLDNKFPPSPASIGEIDLIDCGRFNLEDIQWKRVKDVIGCDWDTQPLLIEDGITPRDIKQGSLGNCWLLSGLACIAQSFPELIESRFVAPRDPETGKPTISTSGRYRIQLWDMRKNTWADIVIDDMIPCCGDGTPLFAKAGGDEAWLLLMEKALAKYFGNYAALEGGNIDLILKIIGGDKVEDHLMYWEPTGEEPWEPVRSGMRVISKTADRTIIKGQLQYSKDASKKLKTVKMFEKLRSWIKSPDNDYIIGAGSKGDSDINDVDGIVSCHAYAVLDIVVLPGFTLLKIANPHGTGCREWKGTWSNFDSKSWKEHPEVAEACGWTGSMAGTGIFWIQELDFDKYFDCLYVARLSKDNAGALAKLAGAAETPKVQPLESGEWNGEEEEEEEDSEDQEEDPEAHLREVFDGYAAGRGTLYRHELLSILDGTTGTTVPPKLVNQLLDAVGLQWNSQVSFKKLQCMLRLIPVASSFMQYDTDSSGSLTRDEVTKIVKQLKASEIAHKGRKARATAKLLGYITGHSKEVVQEQVEAMLDTYDTDQDGEISFREFIDLFDDQLA